MHSHPVVIKRPHPANYPLGGGVLMIFWHINGMQLGLCYPSSKPYSATFCITIIHSIRKVPTLSQTC